ncbi:MAG: hypothetical protein V3R82_03570, partial [Candidatus Hydrothermarchaeales archaeon]
MKRIVIQKLIAIQKFVKEHLKQAIEIENRHNTFMGISLVIIFIAVVILWRAHAISVNWSKRLLIILVTFFSWLLTY